MQNRLTLRSMPFTTCSRTQRFGTSGLVIEGTHDVVYDYNGSPRVKSLHAYHDVIRDNKNLLLESSVLTTLSINAC